MDIESGFEEIVEAAHCVSCKNIVPLVKIGENPKKYSVSHSSWCAAMNFDSVTSDQFNKNSGKYFIVY